NRRHSRPRRYRPDTTEGVRMFDLVPLSPTIGAEVVGCDLAATLDDKSRAFVEEALAELKVLFFCDQDITAEQQVAFARNFGELEIHTFASRLDDAPEVMVLEHGSERAVEGAYRENIWHSDVTWREIPSKASVLRAVEVPAVGG